MSLKDQGRHLVNDVCIVKVLRVGDHQEAQTWLTMGCSCEIAVFMSSLSNDSGNGSFGSNGFVWSLEQLS